MRLAILAGLLVLACGCSWLADYWQRSDGRADNPHVITCTAQGGTVHQDRQFGGRVYTYTWWCQRPDGQITDVWS